MHIVTPPSGQALNCFQKRKKCAALQTPQATFASTTHKLCNAIPTLKSASIVVSQPQDRWQATLAHLCQRIRYSHTIPFYWICGKSLTDFKEMTEAVIRWMYISYTASKCSCLPGPQQFRPEARGLRACLCWPRPHTRPEAPFLGSKIAIHVWVRTRFIDRLCSDALDRLGVCSSTCSAFELLQRFEPAVGSRTHRG